MLVIPRMGVCQEQHKYGVTIQNFIDAGLSIPHKKGTNRGESKHIK